jgi:hypothetical protein
LPHSDIHRQETIVFEHAQALRAAYEKIGGGTRFRDTHSVHLKQVAEYAKAYLDRREPTLDLGVDQVLSSPLNQWLPDMRIRVDLDYARFADGLRLARDHGHAEMLILINQWARDKPTFATVLDRELNDFGPARVRRLARALNLFDHPADRPPNLRDEPHLNLFEEFDVLRRMFRDRGIPDREAAGTVVEYWGWQRNREVPHHRIAAYLNAALARRVAAGQRKVTRGFVNDVRAISTYAPYVDAMFVDRECAELLREGRLRDELEFKAHIFSFADPQAFLDYLKEIEAQATDEVRRLAAVVYGLRA